MSSVVVIPDKVGLMVLQATDSRNIAFDWDAIGLRDNATISTSTFTISILQQGGATILTKDTPSILTGADATVICERTIGDSRVTQVRLIATTATAGDLYEVRNVIVTNESPAQTKTGRVRVEIE
jgi:hypothetical protein